MDYIETFEGERAAQYENRIGTMIPFYSGISELVATSILNSVPAGEKILAAGCGTGADFRALLKIAPDRYSITGVDPSPEMISIARKNFPNAELISSPVSALDPNRKFSAATLLFVLHFLPDDGAKLSLLRDISSRLEPGGMFLLFDLYDSQARMEIVFNELGLYLKTFQGWEEEALKTYIQRVKDLKRIPSARYEDLFRKAGFQNFKQIFQAYHVGGWELKR
ncbi:class I SAM-dependent methyltransferase [Leptospira yasudae]|uniref:Class I SAM-dependent methyltransferase n=1 Tax=Leptospira yasudae TaxID=2202201 RepID=A0ABX9M882_9LEPT|nr:class I SAM-dependent methyltransferase [Leptospira yasudae]MBW0433447.1 class I SAM-dependent methyltransferase [Leptospira yasudae]RHX82089.1 class I SAM-dependent methyltransferase [Leptospira yasudae]RHX95116.1 class I SAM-dependent methyltransferase [Leptospira yasudae]TGK30535.1 class I SAM-dependent methyltransferase [Leptospira yasudae]TGM04085.1 class I SAM-dependent methyltransferase [Leptospira yasudae]